MKQIVFISLLFLIVGCKKNPVTTTEKKQVTVNVKGKPVAAEASLTHYMDGSGKFTLVGGGKNLMLIQITPVGNINYLGGDPRLLNCMQTQAELCQKQFMCRIVCVYGSNISCALGWFISCGLR